VLATFGLGDRGEVPVAVGGGSGAQDGGKRPRGHDRKGHWRWFRANRFGGSPGGGVWRRVVCWRRSDLGNVVRCRGPWEAGVGIRTGGERPGGWAREGHWRWFGASRFGGSPGGRV
jgi:hypothetical protein